MKRFWAQQNNGGNLSCCASQIPNINEQNKTPKKKKKIQRHREGYSSLLEGGGGEMREFHYSKRDCGVIFVTKARAPSLFRKLHQSSDVVQK